MRAPQGIVDKSALRLDSTGVANINSQFPLVNQQSQLQSRQAQTFIRGCPQVSNSISTCDRASAVPDLLGLQSGAVSPDDWAPYDSINMNNLYLQCRALGLTDPLKPNSCDPIILTPISPYLVNPGRLNYFELRSTFRFTVSRTF